MPSASLTLMNMRPTYLMNYMWKDVKEQRDTAHLNIRYSVKQHLAPRPDITRTTCSPCRMQTLTKVQSPKINSWISIYRMQGCHPWLRLHTVYNDDLWECHGPAILYCTLYNNTSTSEFMCLNLDVGTIGEIRYEAYQRTNDNKKWKFVA